MTEGHYLTDQYLNATGFGIFKKDDFSALVDSEYNKAKLKYPGYSKNTCSELLYAMTNLQIDIDRAIKAKTLDDSKVGQDALNRVIDGYTRWQDELKILYNNKKCQDQQDAAAEQQFFDQQGKSFEQVKDFAEKQSATSKYIIFGILGVVVIISGVMVFKK